MKPIFMHLILIAEKTGSTAKHTENKRDKRIGLPAQTNGSATSHRVTAFLIIIPDFLQMNKIQPYV